MKFWILFLVAMFALGGTPLGAWVRQRRWAMIGGPAFAALTFYSLSVAI